MSYNKEFKADDLYFGDVPVDYLFLGDNMLFKRNDESAEQTATGNAR